MKICSGPCNEYKELTEFYKWKRSKDGFTSQCKKCVIYTRKLRKLNPKKPVIITDESIKCIDCKKIYYITEEMKANPRIHPFPLKKDSDKRNKCCIRCTGGSPKLCYNYLHSLGIHEETYKYSLNSKDRKWLERFNEEWYFGHTYKEENVHPKEYNTELHRSIKARRRDVLNQRITFIQHQDLEQFNDLYSNQY